MFISACSTTKKGQKDILSKAAYYANTSLFIDAKRAEYQGNMQEAEQLLNKVLKTDPNNHAAAYELSRLLPKKDMEVAISFAERANKLAPDNKWYLMNLVHLYSYTKDYKKAACAGRKLIKSYPDDIQNYYRLVNIYLKDSDFDNALYTYYQIENKFGFDPDNVLRRKDIFFKLGDYQKASKEMELLIEAYPNEKRYYGIAADIFMADGKEKKAMEYYKKILEIDPKDGKVHLVLSSYFFSQGQKQKSFDEMKKGFRSPTLNVDSKISMMMKFYKITSDNPDDFSLQKQADTLLDILYKEHPNDPKVLAMKGDFLARNKQWKEALEAYQKVIEIDSSKYLIWEQLILISKELKDYSAMQNYSGRALLLFSQYPIVYYFHAQSNYYLGQYNVANASLNLGLSFVYKPQQKVEFYTLMGIVRDSLHQYKEAGTSFEKALIEDANNAPLLAEYAAHLVLINEDLDKAEAYAKKALELSSNTPKYFYTYALVYYAKKDYSKSLIWVENGLKIAPENPFLNNLKGKILLQTGDKEKALLFLNKGKTNEN